MTTDVSCSVCKFDARRARLGEIAENNTCIFGADLLIIDGQKEQDNSKAFIWEIPAYVWSAQEKISLGAARQLYD
jgi:hypothetical protein